MNQKGNLYVIAAPSGAGKTSLVKKLTETIKDVCVSISHTTRPIRPGEQDGVNYFFVPKLQFTNMIEHGDFLEHAIVFENLYGTSKKWVEDTLRMGTDVILEIDWQGYQQIKKLLPSAIGIFILPPSMDDLRERLITRNQDNQDVIEKRLADVRETVSHIDEFDYLVINDDFDKAVQDITTIIDAGRLLVSAQREKYKGLIAYLAGITAK